MTANLLSPVHQGIGNPLFCQRQDPIKANLRGLTFLNS